MRKRDKKNEMRFQKLLFDAYKGIIVELYQNHCPNEGNSIGMQLFV